MKCVLLLNGGAAHYEEARPESPALLILVRASRSLAVSEARVAEEGGFLSS